MDKIYCGVQRPGYGQTNKTAGNTIIRFFMRKFTVCNFEETRQLCVNFFCQGNYNDDGDNDDVEEEEEEEEEEEGRES